MQRRVAGVAALVPAPLARFVRITHYLFFPCKANTAKPSGHLHISTGSLRLAPWARWQLAAAERLGSLRMVSRGGTAGSGALNASADQRGAVGPRRGPMSDGRHAENAAQTGGVAAGGEAKQSQSILAPCRAASTVTLHGQQGWLRSGGTFKGMRRSRCFSRVRGAWATKRGAGAPSALPTAGRALVQRPAYLYG